MKIISIIYFLLCTLTSQSQVMQYFAANENSKDTLANLRYFKNIDKPIVQKLDSFLTFVSTKKSKDASGFIEVSLFRSNANKKIADISINNQYADYRIFTGVAAINNDFGKVFAFTWYKSKLVLFTLSSSSKFRIREEYASILHDLIYAEMSKSVRKEIDNKADEFEVTAPGIVRRYYFD